MHSQYEFHPLGALFELRRKKMLEKEISKLEGQMMVLEQQRMMIQCKSISYLSEFEYRRH